MPLAVDAVSISGAENESGAADALVIAKSIEATSWPLELSKTIDEPCPDDAAKLWFENDKVPGFCRLDTYGAPRFTRWASVPAFGQGSSRLRYAAQFSNFRSGTRPNSPVLLVTRVSRSERA